MTIKRMLLLAGMALAAIAFAAPAAVQANVFLTDENGKVLKKGAKVTATSSNLVTHVGPNTLTCKKVTLHYELTNAGTKEVVLKPLVTGTHNGSAKECEVHTPGGTFPTTITEAGTGTIAINTWGTANVNATFTSGTCVYTGNVHVQGAASGSDIMNVTPATLVGHPLDPCGHGTLTGEVTLETADNPATPETDEVPVFLNFVKTPTP